MKKPDITEMKNTMKNGLYYVKDHGEPIARKAVKSGQVALQSKMGKRIATGALAGGAIAYAIPLLAVSTGAIFGAGALVLFKSLQDKGD